MERYCNRLKPSIRSRRFPYAALDRYVLEDAQLTQIKAFYDISAELALRAPQNEIPQGSLAHEACKCVIVIFKFEYILIEWFADPSFILLPPRKPPGSVGNLDTGILKSIAAALSTRFSIPVTNIRKLLKDATVQEWGKVRRVDSEEGDTIKSSSLGRKASDRRDATFVRVRRFLHLCYITYIFILNLFP